MRYRNIVTNTTELLASYDSRTVNIIGTKKIFDKYCAIYGNGRVIYEENGVTHVLHIDTEFASSFGFVKHDTMFLIYKCVDGELSIYNIGNNHIKQYVLPNKTYHVLPNSVSLVNDTIYCIVGQAEIASDAVIYIDKSNNEYFKFTKNDKTYAIMGITSLHNSSNLDSNIVNNQKRMIVKHSDLGNYDIYNYDVSAEGFIVLHMRDGTVAKIVNGVMVNIIDRLSYYPQQFVSAKNPAGNDNQTFIVSNKMINSAPYARQRYKHLESPRNFTNNFMSTYPRYNYDSDDNIVCVEYNENDKFLTMYKSGDYLKSFESLCAITPRLVEDSIGWNEVIYDPITATDEFNNEFITFSKDGKVACAGLLDNGVVIMSEGKVSFINKAIGFPTNSVCKSAVFGDDGYLYITLMGKGSILRNAYKGDYSKFVDLLSRSFDAKDSLLDTNTVVSRVVCNRNNVWFIYAGSHTALDGTGVLNRGIYKHDSSIGSTKLVTSFDDIIADGGDINLISLNIFCVDNDIMVSTPSHLLIYREMSNTYSKFGSGVLYSNIVGYKSRYVGVDDTGSIHVFSTYRYGALRFNSFKLVDDSRGRNMSLSQVKNFKPYISNVISVKDISISAILTCDDTISILVANVTNDGEIPILRDISIPAVITKDSKIVLEMIDTVTCKVCIKDTKYKSDTCCWVFNPFDKNFEVKSIDYIPSIYNYVNYFNPKLISKSLSTTDVFVNEGIISGDVTISDFGATITDYALGDKFTKSLVGYNKTDYADRVSNETISVSEVVTLKPNHTIVQPIGFGRDDCRIYISRDGAGVYHLINEYTTTGRDIVDIELTPNKFDTLGTPFPGASVFNLIDEWVIGEFNNSVVGLKYVDQVSKVVSKLIIINPKLELIISNPGISFQPNTTYHDLFLFDTNLSEPCFYHKHFGGKVLKFSEYSLDVVDIFGRDVSMSRLQYEPNKYVYDAKIVSIFDPAHTMVDFKRHFTGDVNFERRFALSCRDNYDKLSYERIIEFASAHRNTPITMQYDNDRYFILRTPSIESQYHASLASISSTKFDDYAKNPTIYFYVEVDKTSCDMVDCDGGVANLFMSTLHIFGGNLTDRKRLTHVIDYEDEYTIVYKCTVNSAFVLGWKPGSTYSFTSYINDESARSINIRFRYWSHTIEPNVVSRTSDINTSLTCENSTGMESTGVNHCCMGKIIYDDPRNLTPGKNSTFDYTGRNGYRIIVTPDPKVWRLYDKFEFMRLSTKNNGEVSVVGQLISLGVSTYTFTYAVYKNLTKIYTSNAITVSNDAQFTVGMDVNSTEVSVYLYTGFILQKETTVSIDIYSEPYHFEVLNKFYGDIYNIIMIEDGNFKQTVFRRESAFVGDNVFGNVVAFNRDYKTGNLIAFISPTSGGVFKGRGLLKTVVGSNKFETVADIEDDLQFGDIGYSENLAFKLLCVKSSSGYNVHHTINIFTRKHPEIDKVYETGYLLDVNNVIIDDCDGNGIETCAVEI